MKSLPFLLLAVFAIVTSPLFSQPVTVATTDTIPIYGECGMCKSRIQKALKVAGVSTATWDMDTQLLTVTYNPKTISIDDIQKKVAAVGHDTKKYWADDTIYEKLPGCCRYKRKKLETKQNHSPHHSLSK